ncbi:helix-turn-helix domain-containing protein [Streptomyces sp. NPDC055103]
MIPAPSSPHSACPYSVDSAPSMGWGCGTPEESGSFHRWRAEVPEGIARDNVDVAAVARLADGNPEDLETLDTYCATGSLRRAADLLHLHHSSIARRLDQISKTLGLDVTEATGLTRARIALTTWRLLDDRAV